MADKKVTRQLSIFINDKEVVDSLGGIEKEMRKVYAQMKYLKSGEEDFDQKSKQLKDTLNELKTVHANLKDEIHGTAEEMGAAREAFGNLFNGLATGNMAMAATGLTSIKAAVIGTTKALWAFIATPIGATIAVLASIALATKAWYDYNVEVAKVNKEVAAITKLSDEALDQTRITAKALADTYGVEFKEILETARSNVNSFGISYQEALEKIELGLIKGGAANSEYLESMREYSTFFADAGYSLEEFQSLVNTGIDLGIYQDKLPDAIKEFSLSITEQTPAVRDALINAFGQDFTDRLLKGVKAGSVGVKEALQQISKEAERLGLNSQQAQQLTADLFRGAGEDAGGALKIFNAVTEAIENQKKPLTELEQSMKDLAQSERDAATAKDLLLKSDSFAKWSNEASIFINNVTEKLYEFTAYLISSNEEFKKMGLDQEHQKQVDQWANDALNSFKIYADRRKKSMGDMYDFEIVKEEYLATVRGQLAKATNQATKDSLNAEIKIIEDYQEKRKVVTNKNNLEEIKAAQAAAKKRAEELKKERDDLLKGLDKFYQDYRAKVIKSIGEVDEIIKKSQAERKLNQVNPYESDALVATAVTLEEKLAALRKKSEERRLQDLKSAAEKEDAAIREKWDKHIEEYGMYLDDVSALEAEKDAELRAAREAREAEQKEKDEEKRLESLERAAEINQEIEDERWAKIFSDAEYLAEFELEQQRQRDLAKAQQAQASAEEIEAINRKYDARHRQTGIAMLDFFTNLREQEVKWTELSEQSKMALIKQGLNSAADMFNKGSGAWKALKIAEVSISGVQAAMNAYQSLSGIPIVGPVLGAAAAVAVGVMTAKNIEKIAKTKMEKQPKFFYGGFTGNKGSYKDKFGTVTGVVHDNEYVIPKAMTQNPRYANTIQWLENERLGRQTVEPASLGAGNAGNTGELNNSNIDLAAALQQQNVLMASLLERLNNPVPPNLLIGYKHVEELNEMNREINQSNNNGILNS